MNINPIDYELLVLESVLCDNAGVINVIVNTTHKQSNMFFPVMERYHLMLE